MRTARNEKSRLESFLPKPTFLGLSRRCGLCSALVWGLIGSSAGTDTSAGTLTSSIAGRQGQAHGG